MEKISKHQSSNAKYRPGMRSIGERLLRVFRWLLILNFGFILTRLVEFSDGALVPKPNSDYLLALVVTVIGLATSIRQAALTLAGSLAASSFFFTSGATFTGSGYQHEIVEAALQSGIEMLEKAKSRNNADGSETITSLDEDIKEFEAWLAVNKGLSGTFEFVGIELEVWALLADFRKRVWTNQGTVESFSQAVDAYRSSLMAYYEYYQSGSEGGSTQREFAAEIRNFGDLISRQTIYSTTSRGLSTPWEDAKQSPEAFVQLGTRTWNLVKERDADDFFVHLRGFSAFRLFSLANFLYFYGFHPLHSIDALISHVTTPEELRWMQMTLRDAGFAFLHESVYLNRNGLNPGGRRAAKSAYFQGLSLRVLAKNESEQRSRWDDWRNHQLLSKLGLVLGIYFSLGSDVSCHETLSLGFAYKFAALDPCKVLYDKLESTAYTRPDFEETAQKSVVVPLILIEVLKDRYSHSGEADLQAFTEWVSNAAKQTHSRNEITARWLLFLNQIESVTTSKEMKDPFPNYLFQLRESLGIKLLEASSVTPIDEISWGGLLVQT